MWPLAMSFIEIKAPYKIFVARRGPSARASQGRSLGSFPRLKTSLPQQFDDAINRTIELIDVLWLKGDSIQAAFRNSNVDYPTCPILLL